MKFFNWFAALWVTLALVACGGGGGSAGTQAGGSAQAALAVSSFVYQLSKNALNNSGADYTVLTLTALDGSNNPVAGTKVSVSPDTGIYSPDASVTDEKGVVTGRLAINPSDKSDRDITSIISVGGKSATVVVPVTGSQIALTLVPATPAPGQAVSLSVKVMDVNGAAIPDVNVTLSGNLGFAGALSTGGSGSRTVGLGAVPSVAGTYTVEARGSGVSFVKTVQVVSSTGSIPAVTDVISAASLSAVPGTIAPNVPGSTLNRSSLRAVFQNGDNQAIPNVRVRFEVMPPGLGSGEQVSTASTLAYSDVNGVAEAEYIAGSRPSPTNGVVIRACYGRTDAELAGAACPGAVHATLTVASSPLSISIGDNNIMVRGNGGLTYIKDLDVAVADSAGSAVEGAVLSLSVDIRQYRKAASYNAVDQIWCANEDVNRNGFLDAGEDSNGNGNLEPRKADVIASFPGSNRTDASGRARVRLEWAQNFATWLQYGVRLSTHVAGSEGTVEKSYVTQFLMEDAINGAFRIPQYGAALDCSNPN